MISSSVIISRLIAAIICVLFPIIILIYYKRKEKLSLKPVIIGMMVFIVFTQVLEKLLHSVVLENNLITNPVWLAIYGGLAAGVFEESGRFIAFKMILKNKHEWKDGVSYGIGHGGIEAVLLGAVANIQFIIYSNIINSGLFDTVLGSKVPAAQASQLQQKGCAQQFELLGIKLLKYMSM